MKVIKSKQNFSQLEELDSKFHDTFLELSKNPYLMHFNTELKLHATRVENLYFSLDLYNAKSTDEHSNIIKLIENNDLESAMKATKNNWLRFVKNDLKYLKL